jgi:hypothetical protein
MVSSDSPWVLRMLFAHHRERRGTRARDAVWKLAARSPPMTPRRSIFVVVVRSVVAAGAFRRCLAGG